LHRLDTYEKIKPCLTGVRRDWRIGLLLEKGKYDAYCPRREKEIKIYIPQHEAGTDYHPYGKQRSRIP
jgi:hypothetical protein